MIPNYSKSIINIEPMYNSLYEVINFNNGNFETIDFFEFNIDNNKVVCKIYDSNYIEMEKFKSFELLIVKMFDRTGSIIKWMKLDVKYNKMSYSLGWERNDISTIEIQYDLVNIKTYNDDNVCGILLQLKRDYILSSILN